ncbi:MAG: type II toxin-antitoxin system HigB family toxin [Prolixibacteraceae bacterium]
MRVISHRTLVNFYLGRPDAKTAIENWYTKTSCADWQFVADIKNDFNSVDNIRNQHFVFNLKGNEYRLVAVIKFQIKMVYIRFIGTHTEYNTIDCKNI